MTRLIFAAFAVAASILAATTRADLQSDVRSVLQDKYLAKASVGVAIARLRDKAGPDFVFRSSSEARLIPASNLKIVTTAAALDRLGAEFRFRTMLLQKDRDLYLIGDGDPTFGDVEMLKKRGWGVDSVYKLWAQELKKRAITNVANIVVDDSVFDAEFIHPNWPTDQAHKRYVAQVGGMNLNANCIDFIINTTAIGQPVTYQMIPQTSYITLRNACMTGDRDAVWLSRELGGNNVVLRGQTNVDREEPVSVTIHDPPMFAATVLAERLTASGIAVEGAVLRDRDVRRRSSSEAEQGGWKIVAALETQLPSVLARANKDSMNLYAEALCKRMGFQASGQSGSWENGAAAMGAFLRDCGVPDEQFQLDDGCGLSKNNAISAEAIVRVLARQHEADSAELFRSSLAVSGVDGTLEDRFRGSDLQGRVYGKSGYVNYVSALSGYLCTKDGQWYAFAILMNEVPFKTNNKAKEIQERIVNAIDSNASPSGAAASR